MEIATLPKNSIKIKGKVGTLELTPETKLSVEGHPLEVYGPGEYEVAGIKISSVGESGNLVHVVRVDNVDIACGKAETLSKLAEKLNESSILAIYADGGSPAAAVTSLAPKVVVLYGDKAQEVAKDLGKEEVKAVSKYVTTREKLPTDMEVVVLG